MPYADFILKYNVEFNQQFYTDWEPVALARSAIFPVEYRALASEYYLGYLLCLTAGDRQSSEVKRFEVKPEGYSVEYADNAPKCDRWLVLLRELGIAAGVTIPELQRTRTFGADRTENFCHPF